MTKTLSCCAARSALRIDINNQKLDALAGDGMVFYGVDRKGGSNERVVHDPSSAEHLGAGRPDDEDLIVRGKFSSSIYSNMPVSEVVQLKLGAKVLATSSIGGVVVGSLGHVQHYEHMSDAEAMRCMSASDLRRNKSKEQVLQDWKAVNPAMLWPRVKFRTGGACHSLVVKPVTVTLEDNVGRLICSRVQVPLLLGYALTIHRSQGMTLKKVMLDMTELFAEGQLYTALSRVRDFKCLRLKGELKTGLKLCDARVLKFESEGVWYDVDNSPAGFE